jgi:Tol biopolymer transport system component
MNLDGTGFQQITTGNGMEQYPAWSPDGKQLAAWNQFTLITFNADGTGTVYDFVASHQEIFYNFLSDIPFCWR